MLTVAIVYILSTHDLKTSRYLENIRIGVFCWAFLSALSTLWTIIEALFRSLSLRKLNAEIAALIGLSEETTPTPPVVTPTSVSSTAATKIPKTDHLTGIADNLRKETTFVWLFSVAYAALAAYCIFQLLKVIRDVAEIYYEEKANIKNLDPTPGQFGIGQFLPGAKIESIDRWAKGQDSGFNSPTTSISTISTDDKSGSAGGQRYTDIDEADMTNSYKSGSMPYPIGEMSHHMAHNWSRVQMDQKSTREHLMARFTGTLPGPGTDIVSHIPGLKVTPEVRPGPKKYEDSRQYEMRKTLPRNLNERITVTPEERINKRPPSKGTLGTGQKLEWNEIVPYIDQTISDSSQSSASSQQSGSDWHKNAFEPKLPRLLSEQIERALHLDNKLQAALQKTETLLRNSSSTSKNFQIIEKNQTPRFTVLQSEPNPVTQQIHPEPEKPEKSVPNKPIPGKMPPVNNFKPGGNTLDKNNNSQTISNPPVPPRDHPAHQKSQKESVSFKSKNPALNRVRQTESGLTGSTSSFDGSICRSMSFASINSKETDFSRNTLGRSSLKSASLASTKKKVRFGNFQEEFTPYEEKGTSKKRNMPIKTQDGVTMQVISNPPKKR